MKVSSWTASSAGATIPAACAAASEVVVASLLIATAELVFVYVVKYSLSSMCNTRLPLNKVSRQTSGVKLDTWSTS